MAKFGLACEGITDQIVIENILCGFYKDYKDLDEEIQAFQPAYDETTKKQKEGEFGGWGNLLNYLSETRFRDDVLNSQYTIIQVDTDICDLVNFNVPKDTSCITTFIENIKEKLILSIDKNETFYEANQSKIIFAISVHSLECWLLPIYKDVKKEKITSCFEALKRECKSIKVEKNYETYDKLSKSFLKNKELLKISSKNSSFQIFINNLPKDLT
jgi:hypothetical protein